MDTMEQDLVDKIELYLVGKMELDLMDTMDMMDTAVTGGAVVIGTMGIADDC
jgi:hypothetical protein